MNIEETQRIIPMMTTAMTMSRRQDTMRVAAVITLFSMLILSAHGRPLDNPTKAEDNDDPLKPAVPADEETPAAGAFGGDMMLSPKQMAAILGIPMPDVDDEDDQGSQRVKRKATTNLIKRWPKNTIPYVIEETSMADSDVIRSALMHWEEKTCLRFVPYTVDVGTELGHHQHISFFKGEGCWSFLGRIGETGAQKISIGPKCAVFGTVAHEIGHSVGFFHEQSRPDRDDYVVVNIHNVRSDLQGNFIKRTADMVVSDITYDLKSIMHYGAYSFAVNSSIPTMTTVNPLDFKYIGQRKALSFRDAKTANLIYECSSDCPPLNCSNEGYVGPDCTCLCPEEFTGPQCLDANPDYVAPCDYVLTSDSGYIESPNFGEGKYPENTICMYHIKPVVTEPNTRITLTFDAFSVEVSDNCEWDYVRVFDDQLTYGGQTFCGTTLPPPITSVGPEMVVWFRSDTYQTMLGFRANYSIEVVPPRTSRGPTEPAVNTKPTTEPVVTTKPITEPPVTTKTTTEPPVPTKPTTEPVVTTKPITEPPITTKPTTEPPVTTKPTTEPPVTTKPTTEPVVTTKPITEAPVTTKPTTEPPVTTKPATEPPVTITSSPVSTECLITYSGNSGDLKSPNYPKKYPGKYKCNYTITVPAGQRIVLEFKDFDIESDNSIFGGSTTCTYDYIAVYLGRGIQIPMRLCGNKEPEASLISLANTMTLEFITDGSVEKRGFFASYHTINDSLPGLGILDVGQSITSDTWPRVCPGRLHGTCIYHIEVPDDNRVELAFQSMAGLVESDFCQTDSMVVDLGEGIAVPMVICGNGLPEGPIVSLSNTIDLKFTTAEGGTKPSFSALYRAVPEAAFDLPNEGKDGSGSDESDSDSGESDSSSNNNGNGNGSGNVNGTGNGMGDGMGNEIGNGIGNYNKNGNGGGHQVSDNESGEIDDSDENNSDSGESDSNSAEDDSDSGESDSGSNSNSNGNGNGNGHGNGKNNRN